MRFHALSTLYRSVHATHLAKRLLTRAWQLYLSLIRDLFGKSNMGVIIKLTHRIVFDENLV
jgi:hypothetical protein